MQQLKKNILGLTLGSLLIVFAIPQESAAQFAIGPHLGLNTDGGDVIIGLAAQFGIETSNDFYFLANPGFDYYLFQDNVNQSRLNLDALYPIDAGDLALGFGGGLAFQFLRLDLPEDVAQGIIEENDVNLGLNLKANAGFPLADTDFMLMLDVNLGIFNGGNDFTLRPGIVYRSRR